MPSGCTLEQVSCTNPGAVRVSDRMPPPGVSAASYTTTDNPARASTIAAASPFGPAPTTITSRRARLSGIALRRPQHVDQVAREPAEEADGTDLRRTIAMRGAGVRAAGVEVSRGRRLDVRREVPALQN